MNWEVLTPIIIYIFLTFVVGIFANQLLKKGKGEFKESYFIGGRSLGPLLLTFTILASAASSGTFIGGPGVAYDVGFGWVLVLLTQVGMGVYVLGVLGKKFAIIARKIDAVTLTDFLKARYNSNLVVIGSALGIVIFLTAYMIAQFVGGAIILEAVTGFPYGAGLILFGVILVVYTTIGGFMAVALTDAIQGLMMILGGVILWIAFFKTTGGFSELIGDLSSNHPELLELPGPAGVTSALLVSYFLLFGIAAIGLPHASVRGMSFKNSKAMHRSIMYSGIVMFLFTIGFTTLGPFVNLFLPNLENPDMALPALILEVMPGWLAGLVLAAPLAAVMSTVNAMLLVASSTVVKDIYLNYIKPDATQRNVKKISYYSTAIIGLIVIFLSLTPPDYLQYLVIYAIGGLEATIFAPIVFGLYWKRANRAGAMASMYSGLGSYILLDIVTTEPFGMHVIATSLAISVLAMVAVSYLTPKPSEQLIQKFWGKESKNANIYMKEGS